MKIIKQGQLPEDKIWRGKCHYCKTEYECTLKDGKITHDQRDGSFLRVTCPFCKKEAFAYESH